MRVLQWLLILSALGGAVWLAALAVMAYLQLPEPTTPDVRGIPVPTLMLVGGVLLGVLLALAVPGPGVPDRPSAARRAVDRRLRTAISTVSQELVVAPIEVELAAYARARAGLENRPGLTVRPAPPPQQRRTRHVSTGPPPDGPGCRRRPEAGS